MSAATTATHVLEVRDLSVAVEGNVILEGVDLTVRSGEVHAVMGPNGSGKSTLSHVLMGKPGYEVLGGSVTLDGRDLLGLPTHERAAAGLYLAMQYPIEVPGVAVEEALREALLARGVAAEELYEMMVAEASRIGFDERFLARPLNVDLSGGEKKRNETMQIGVLRPAIVVLDEIDSGLDIDALRMVSRRIEEQTTEHGVGVLAITHYSRLFHELAPDVVHVLVRGRLVDSGGPELAERIETEGYTRYGPDEDGSAAAPADPFADPFADPLA